MKSAFVSEPCPKGATSTTTGSLVDLGGERYYRIENFNAMPPFL